MGTGITTAIWFCTSDHGTVMCTPFAGRIDDGLVPSSSARTSSDHTPVAFTTTDARTSIV